MNRNRLKDLEEMLATEYGRDEDAPHLYKPPLASRAKWWLDNVVWPLILFIVFLVLTLVFVAAALAAPQDAVVRMPSHGASGTVIYTRSGYSLVLTCAHAFRGRDRYKRLALDVPHHTPGSKRVAVQLVAVDYASDLALVAIADGPLPYVCQPAGPGANPRACLSAGYDNMRLPATRLSATVRL
jgi:hypothetical protein